MSYIKVSSDEFLEKQELDRLVKFLDTDGFRALLLDNSSSFGFVKRQGSAFTNGLVQQDTGLTVKINEAFLIDSNGNVIHSDAVSQLAIPNDNNFYWIKITHAYSSKEKGTFSIDSLGNLTCTSLDAELLTILRGQPNYPSRVRFLNASNNILSYDVEEVIDNNNATLTGSFTAETGLTLSVVGTFTPGHVPLSSEKDIFQYDSATISLVQSNATIDSSITHTTGLDFFMARVKRNGASLIIEDKRNDIWTTNATYLLQYLSRAVNPLIGVEQITFNDQFTPRDRNILEMVWSFRCVTFNVDLKLNKVTVSAGSGGLFKADNFDTQFQDGDFDNWRLYTEDGKYYNIISSRLNAGTIELTCDNIEATSFYSDVNSLIPIQQVLNVTPQAEEIEIICTPDADTSDSTSAAQHGLCEVKKTFPINETYGRIELTVYHATLADYTITYRYKHLLSYGPVIQIPDDSTGYYNESQFNVHGKRVGSTRTSYSNGLVTLILDPKAYVNFQAKVDTGDLHGVDTVTMSNADIPVITLVVGGNKQYQHYIGSLLTLSGDLSINLSSVDVNSDTLKDGASFTLHLEQPIALNSHNFKIVYNYTTTPVVLKTFDTYDSDYISSERGLTLIVTWDKSNTKWILSSPSIPVRAKTGSSGAFVDSGAIIATMTPSLTQNVKNMIANYSVSIQSAGVGVNTVTIRLYKNAVIQTEVVHTIPADTYQATISLSAMFDYTAGDVLHINGYATTSFSGTVTDGGILTVSGLK